MPPQHSGEDRRVGEVLDLATRLQQLLHERTAISTNVVSEIEAVIDRCLPFPTNASLAGKGSILDDRGSMLWNSATRIIREPEVQSDSRKGAEPPRFVMLLRSFAYLLLDAAFSSSLKRLKDLDQQIRIFKVALAAARYCLTEGATTLAPKILERCTAYSRFTEQDSPISQEINRSSENADDGRAILRRLVMDLYLLRIMHATTTDNLDVAEFFFSKLSVSTLKDNNDLLERAADLFYNIGSKLLKNARDDLAITWLERALTTLNGCDEVDFGQQTEDLRLAVTSKLTRALSNNGESCAMQRAWSLTVALVDEFGLGHRTATLVMRLELLLQANPIDEAMVHQELFKMIRCALTANTFNAIMQAIHKTRQSCATCAYEALAGLLVSRILPDIDIDSEATQYREWLEKILVTLTLYQTSDPILTVAEASSALRSLFDQAFQCTNASLSREATHASQILLWKAAGSIDSDPINSWIELLSHPLFGNAGDVNKARIQRLVMSTAMARGDVVAARAAFYRMVPSVRNQLLSRYLAYKVALRSSDYQWATENLEFIVKHASDDQKFLYACALEAQQSANRSMAIDALQAIVDKTSQGMQSPTVLRCMVRLRISDLDLAERTPEECMPELLTLFEIAGNGIKGFPRDSHDEWQAEVKWWTKNAYNLALRVCTIIHPCSLLRLLQVCDRFLECYAAEAPPSDKADALYRKQICSFISVSTLIVLARSADETTEEALQHYLQATKEVDKFLDTWQHPEPSHPEFYEIQARAFELHKFRLEAIFKLRQWQNLDVALSACIAFKSVDRWDRLADLALIIHKELSSSANEAHAKCLPKITDLLQKIINETWKSDKNITQVARWVRAVFSTDIAAASRGIGEGKVALSFLGQAAVLARRGEQHKNHRYPEDELQWLASVSFNRGIDFCIAAQQQAAGVWFEGAMEIARYADDRGTLHACLSRRRTEADRKALGMAR